MAGSVEPGVDNLAVSITVTRPDGFRAEMSVTTGSDGRFAAPLSADQPGAWTVRASWPGNSDYLPCEAVASFVVEKKAAHAWLAFLAVGVVAVLGAATGWTVLIRRRRKPA